MKKSTFKKWLSVLLAIAITITMIGGTPGNLFRIEALETEQQAVTAENAVEPVKSSEQQFLELKQELRSTDCAILRYVEEDAFARSGHVERLTKEEKLNTYVFRNYDGSKTVYYMGENIKYIDKNGEIKEKDITLTASASGYHTKQNSVLVDIPVDPASGVDVEYDGYQVSIIPQNSDALRSTVLRDNAVTYSNYYGSGNHLKYTPTMSGIKEDIILNSYTGVNSFEFTLHTDGLLLVKKGEDYILTTEDGELKMYLGKILVYDAMGKPDDGFIEVETVKKGQEYLLTIGANEEFLTDSETVYPVTIDPTITVSDSTYGANAIEDAPIFQNKASSNFGAYTYNRVGYAGTDYGIGRTVVRLKGLIEDSDYMASSVTGISSVLFYVKESSGTSSVSVSIYPLTSNTTWTETSINWSNVGSWATTDAACESLSGNAWTAFDITALAQAWKNGTYNANAGFIMISSSESTVNKSFCSSEFTTTANIPYVVATYASSAGSLNYTNLELTEGSTVNLQLSGITGTAVWSSTNSSVASVSSNGVVTAVRAGTAAIIAAVPGYSATVCNVKVIVADGVYKIKHSASNYYLGAANAGISNETSVTLQNQVTYGVQHLAQLWKVKYLGDDYYSIRPLHKLNMALDITAGVIDIYHAGTNDTVSGVPSYTRWKLTYDSNGYYFTNARDGVGLKPDGGVQTAGTAIVGSAYTNSSTTRWEFVPYSGVASSVLIYDTQSEICSGALVRYVKSGETYSLSDLQLEAAFSSPGTIDQSVTWESSNPSIVWVDSSSGTLVGGNVGGPVTITARKWYGGNYYTSQYYVNCYENSVNVEVLYDGGYASRYGASAESRIMERMDALREEYWDKFEIFVNYSSPESFDSYADTSCTPDPNVACTHANEASCINSSLEELKEFHHKNLYNILHRIGAHQNTTIVKIAFIGHRCCSQYDHNSTEGLYGLAIKERRVLVVNDFTGEAHEVKSLVHEFGHMFYAPDHYDGEGYSERIPSTSEINSQYNTHLFNTNCIYGEGEETTTITENLTICAGCQAVIAQNATRFSGS